ncbi:hypothetical protein QT381_08360 [Galbitalea sp. SE-J8]|uniref:hypothetical protein n=1 Tax=Galbitalea sp. SE-J8 TaxID=3054952 RepID=UPI00259CD346|nr:hypothetical protein [Galbitalea sp. SE-J8]MDM4763019.1 hypothetical protein [Galbitalea sp. SE-J8]
MRVLPLVPATIAVVVTCGCSPSASPPTPTAIVSSPHASAHVVGAAEAEAVFAQYLQVTDQIAQDGGVGADRLDDFVAGTQRELERETAQAILENSVHQIGSSSYRSFTVQQSTGAGLSAYVCLDRSHVDVVTSEGLSLDEQSIKFKRTMLVRVSANDDGLRVEWMRPWAGMSVC